MLGVDVIITLTKLRSLRVFVLGEAFKPGPYILSSLSSITHALFAAGGINAIGSLRNIQLKRGGKLITTLDLYDLLIAGDSSNDIILESGDVIFIAPVGDRVTIDGEIKRAAIYELKGGETFQTMIEMSGGLLPSAFPSATVVEGFTKNNLRSVRGVDLTQKANLALKVNGGDAIKIMKTSELYENSVTLIGAFTRPGKYQWTAGQRLSDLIPNAHSYLLADADLAYGLIVREKDRARNIELLQFDFSNVINSKQSRDNLLLKPLDRVIIFSINENQQQKFEQLDSLAFTRNKLNDAEKAFAKDEYDEQKFWREYGNKNDAKLRRVQTNEADTDTGNLEDFSGDERNKIVFQQLNTYSRQRILLPIIKRLKQQAAAGEPMQLVEVDGSVKYPGIYPLAINAKIDDLLKASGGLLESAYLKRAEITRNYLINNQLHKESIKVDLAGVLSENKESNLTLLSKDHLTVLQIPAWQENHIVELRGEFVFPGKYTIKRGETLGSLIERVSGFTDYAYTEAAVFTRAKLRELEKQNIRKVAENLRAEIASKSLAQNNGSQSIDYSQAKLLLADLSKVTPIGRLVVDIPKLKTDKNLDVLLEDGDVVYVPSRQNSVNVIGQIQVASSHIHQNNLSAYDYIALSGGIKKQADDERIYVIKANGSVEIPASGNWFASSTEQAIDAGDTVVVPLDSDYMNSLTLWSTGTQIIYQAAVAIAAISGI
jgi:polysaccharide export outer membrane protein